MKDDRIPEIKKCNQQKFHEHKDSAGLAAWEICQHIEYKTKAEIGMTDLKIRDLR